MPTPLERLVFLRWLIERGRLEHYPAGESCGPLVALRGAVARGRAG